MDGILNLLKPPGMTSSNAVVDVRRRFHEKKVGHTGTLDPGAAGVLPICLGKATRLFDYLVEKEKEYIAEISFGTATDTLDSYGTVTRTQEGRVEGETLRSALPDFLGAQWQIPPMYSAVKLDGKKLYQLARRGEEVELVSRKRRIVIEELELLEQTGENRFLLKIRCSKGTYVRVLCADIGERLSLPCHMSFLLRSRSGPFMLDGSLTLNEAGELIEAGEIERALTPMDQALCFLPEAVAEDSAMRFLRNGNPVPLERVSPCETGRLHRVYCGGIFAGIGIAKEDRLVMKTLLMHINSPEED